MLICVPRRQEPRQREISNSVRQVPPPEGVAEVGGREIAHVVLARMPTAPPMLDVAEVGGRVV